MRSFITALLILAALITLVLANSAAVLHCTDALTALCRETSDGSAPDAADRLLARWERCRDFLSLSVHHREIDAADAALIAALSAADPITRDANLSLFAAALRRIADSGRLNLLHIF